MTRKYKWFKGLVTAGFKGLVTAGFKGLVQSLDPVYPVYFLYKTTTQRTFD